jgi:hypothetical protein
LPLASVDTDVVVVTLAISFSPGELVRYLITWDMVEISGIPSAGIDTDVLVVSLTVPFTTIIQA